MEWRTAKAPRVLIALLRSGWSIERQKGSHRILAKPGRPDFTFAFHDTEEIGRACSLASPNILGLRPIACNSRSPTPFNLQLHYCCHKMSTSPSAFCPVALLLTCRRRGPRYPGPTSALSANRRPRLRPMRRPPRDRCAPACEMEEGTRERDHTAFLGRQITALPGMEKACWLQRVSVLRAVRTLNGGHSNVYSKSLLEES